MLVNSSYIFGVVFSLVVFGSIFWNLRAGRMKERYALWWLVIGVVVVVISVFPSILGWLSTSLGVEVPFNLGLFAGGVVLLLMTLQFSAGLSKTDDRQRRLTEEIALLQVRVEEAEAAVRSLQQALDKNGKSGE